MFKALFCVSLILSAAFAQVPSFDASTTTTWASKTVTASATTATKPLTVTGKNGNIVTLQEPGIIMSTSTYSKGATAGATLASFYVGVVTSGTGAVAGFGPIMTNDGTVSCSFGTGTATATAAFYGLTSNTLYSVKSATAGTPTNAAPSGGGTSKCNADFLTAYSSTSTTSGATVSLTAFSNAGLASGKVTKWVVTVPSLTATNCFTVAFTPDASSSSPSTTTLNPAGTCDSNTAGTTLLTPGTFAFYAELENVGTTPQATFCLQTAAQYAIAAGDCTKAASIYRAVVGISFSAIAFLVAALF